MKILGILNITDDSFSDGGKFLQAGAAQLHAKAMAQSGADIIDIGAASSNPDSKPVATEVEIARLASVVPALKEMGRNEDSMRQVLALLQSEQDNVKKDPELWAYWQRRAGKRACTFR